MVLRAAEWVTYSSTGHVQLFEERHGFIVYQAARQLDWEYGVWNHKGHGDCELLVFALLNHVPDDGAMHGDMAMCVRSEVLVDREADFFGKIESEKLSTTSMIAGFLRALSRRFRSLHRDSVLLPNRG
jgi:hypothetical protein